MVKLVLRRRNNNTMEYITVIFQYRLLKQRNRITSGDRARCRDTCQGIVLLGTTVAHALNIGTEEFY